MDTTDTDVTIVSPEETGWGDSFTVTADLRYRGAEDNHHATQVIRGHLRSYPRPELEHVAWDPECSQFFAYVDTEAQARALVEVIDTIWPVVPTQRHRIVLELDSRLDDPYDTAASLLQDLGFMRDDDKEIVVTHAEIVS